MWEVIEAWIEPLTLEGFPSMTVKDASEQIQRIALLLRTFCLAEGQCKDTVKKQTEYGIVRKYTAKNSLKYFSLWMPVVSYNIILGC